MDPICHTLVGAAMSKGGLDRWTPRATAVLMVAANAPDVDIVAAFFGQSLAWRRGLTHGIPALIVWPLPIALLAVLLDRRRPRPNQPPARFWPTASIAAIGVLSHPFLDYLNNYGMRWLMPLRDIWFYGDSLFIVDPWLYLLLGTGLWLSGRRRRARAADPARPARLALAAASIYIGAMIAATGIGRSVAERALGDTHPSRLMVTAVPVNPFRKQLVVAEGGGYRVGSVDLLAASVRLDSLIARGPRFADATALLERDGTGRALIRWSRFPVVRELSDGRLRYFDLRYSDGQRPSFASLDVRGDGDSPRSP